MALRAGREWGNRDYSIDPRFRREGKRKRTPFQLALQLHGESESVRATEGDSLKHLYELCDSDKRRQPPVFATPIKSQVVHDHVLRSLHRFGTHADMLVVCEQHDLGARCHFRENAKACRRSFIIELHQHVINYEG
jgi:hypothetical protein